MRDLNQTDSSFTTQASFWTASSLKSTTIYTQCNNVYVLGGYNILGSPLTSKGDYYQRVYTSLATHNMIYFTLSLWAIDDWTTDILNTDRFQLQFDGTLIDGIGYQTSNFPSQLCGSSTYNDLASIRVFGRVAHSAGTLILRVIHMIGKDSSLASVAVRDIDLLFMNNVLASTTTQFCATTSISSCASACTCPEGQYESPVGSGTCVACDSSCASCFGSSTKECYQCKSGYTFNGYECILCDKSCSICSGTANTQCSVCASGYWLLNNNTCVSSCNSPFIQSSDGQQNYCTSPCNSNQYILWDGSCSSSCDSPLQQVALYTGVNYCNYTCDISQYLFWNGTCSSTCTLPLVSKVQNCRNFCTYPCSSGEFLNSNGTCISSCSFPLLQTIQSGKNFCASPCTSDQFLYWNGTCLSSCSSPFIAKIHSDKAFCETPCQNPSDFIYMNGTCSSSCNSPFQQILDGTTKLCAYKCHYDEYLYANNSCLATCNAPWKQRSQSGNLYCDSPCSSGEYLFWNESCLSACEAPLLVESQSYGSLCILPCDNIFEYYNDDTQTCSSECNGQTVNYKGLFFKCMPANSSTTNEADQSDDEEANEGLLVIVFKSLTKPGGVTLIPINRLLQYINYLDMELPVRLERLARNQGRELSSLALRSRMSKSLRADFKNSQLPLVFEKRGLHSRFLVNFWESLFVLIAFTLTALILSVLHYTSIRFKWTRYQPVFQRFKHLFCFNLCIVYFAVNIGDIILYASLELKTTHINQISSALSLIICLAAILLSIALFTLSFVIGRQPKNNKINPSSDDPQRIISKVPSSKHESLQVLFLGFHDQIKASKYFFLLYIARASLPMFFTSCLVHLPIVQIVMNIILCLSMLLFVLFKEPLKSKVNHVQLLILEALVLLVNISIFTLALIDDNKEKNLIFWNFLGDLSINGIITIDAFIFGVLIFKIITETKAIYRSQKMKIVNQKSGWFDIFLPFVQQAAYGFEEVMLPLHILAKSQETGDNKAKSQKVFFKVIDNQQGQKDEEANRRLNDISPDPSFYNSHVEQKQNTQSATPTLLSDPVFSESDVLAKEQKKRLVDLFPHTSQSRTKPTITGINSSRPAVDQGTDTKQISAEDNCTEGLPVHAKPQALKISLEDTDKKSGDSNEHIEHEKDRSSESTPTSSFVGSPYIPQDKHRRQRPSIFKPPSIHIDDDAKSPELENRTSVPSVYESIKYKSILNSMVTGTTPRNAEKMKELKKSLAVPTIIALNQRRKSTFA